MTRPDPERLTVDVLPEVPWRDATILIVDDQENNVRILERMLTREGYSSVHGTSDPAAGIELYGTLGPDLLVLDLHMPRIGGFEVLERIAPLLKPDGFDPILVISADMSQEAKQRALSMGAKDFLNKPFDTTEVLLRIRNLLEARYLYLAVLAQNEVLERKVASRSRELERAQREILDRLALAAEFRDDETRQHTQRVGQLSADIASELGLPDRAVQLLRRAAPLHDLGKVAVPDSILLKLGRLTDEEFAVIKSHTTIGAKLLSGSRHDLLKLAEEIALTHHEHWDGSGYDTGMKGNAIPLVSRIVAVADVFDALTHARPYKPAWPVEEAAAEINRQRGKHFDPDVVDALLRVLRRPVEDPAT